MSYKKAAQILPDELIRQIQQYVDGEAIYIPAQTSAGAPGATLITRRELRDHQQNIYREYLGGATMYWRKVLLSLKSIQRISTLRRQGA